MLVVLRVGRTRKVLPATAERSHKESRKQDVVFCIGFSVKEMTSKRMRTMLAEGAQSKKL